MYNILSIDMKFLLKPCIQLYNDLVSIGIPYPVIWDRIYAQRGCKDFLSLDKDNYRFLSDLFSSIRFSPKTKICLSFDHTNILRAITMLSELDGEILPPFRIVNIDHAHDLGSNISSITDMVRFDLPTNDNWAQYLFSKELVDIYCWVSNENSKPYEGPDLGDKFFSVYKQDFVFNQDEYDLIFICSSLHWFPRHLINQMLLLLQPVFDNYDTDVICYSDHYSKGFDNFRLKDYREASSKINFEEI